MMEMFFYIYMSITFEKRVLLSGDEKGQEGEMYRIVHMIKITSINIYNTLLAIVLRGYNAAYLCHC